MLTFAWYLLKVILVSGILFSYYWFALRNRKFHLYNRFYLLAAVVISWVIPVLKINLWEETQPQVINLLTVVANGDRFVEESNGYKWNWNTASLVILVFISAIFLTRLIISIVQMRVLISRNPSSKWNDINFVFTNAEGTPFSFFKYIFWNTEIDLESAEGKQILKHELAHVRERHSADKIFLSIVLTGSWYNPFIWLIRKELNMIHEFIADQKAVTDGDAASFASMILKTAYPVQSRIIANSFFHSPIKRRLIMLTNIRNPRYSYTRRLMILPLLTVVILFFAFRLKEKKINGQYGSSEAASFANSQNEIPAQFPGGMASWKRYLERNLNLNVLKEHNAPVGNYAPVIVFTVNTDGSISNIVAERKAGFGTEEEAIKLIKKGPKWEPAKRDGLFIESKVKQTINFVINGSETLVSIDSIHVITGRDVIENSIFAYPQDTTKKKNMETKVMNVTVRDSTGKSSTISKSVTFTIKDTGKLMKPLVVLDGKEMTWEEFNKRDIKPDRFESINVLKDKSATDKYGDKGKNGVIIITLKSQISDQKNFEVQQKKFEAEKENSEVKQKGFEVQQKKFEVEQKKQEEQTKYSRVFTVVENPPYYPGGMSEFAIYINSNIQYPKEALQGKVQGAVLIQFIVNEEGKLTDFKKLSSKGHGLEEEAIRLLKNSGEWKPGIQNGHKVPVQIQQKVIFELPKKS